MRPAVNLAVSRTSIQIRGALLLSVTGLTPVFVLVNVARRRQKVADLQ